MFDHRKRFLENEHIQEHQNVGLQFVLDQTSTLRCFSKFITARLLLCAMYYSCPHTVILGQFIFSSTMFQKIKIFWKWNSLVQTFST